MDLSAFLTKVSDIYQGGKASEHSYRPALQELLSSIKEGVTALNEPRRIACGAPDLILERDNITIGYLEAKDIDLGIRNMKGQNRAQQERYRGGLPNLIYTNCLD